MKLIHRSPAPSNAVLRRLALVTHADAPPQGASLPEALSCGAIRVVVDLGSGPVEVAGTFRFAEDHWLVRGMDVTVLVDPARPAEFEVDWGSVASMADRVAANDPALADPFTAGRRVAQALGLTSEDAGTDRFAGLMTAAAAAPPVPEKLRAVVLIAAIRGRMEIGSSDTGPSTTEDAVHRNWEAVLAVNVPGRAPYAVFVPSFTFPRHPDTHPDVPGGGLPALVSATNPNDVQVQWDDIPSIVAPLVDRMSASMLAAQDRMARQQSLAALAPQMREMMIGNLRRSLRYVADPVQRQIILDQYRALGVDIEGVGLDGVGVDG